MDFDEEFKESQRVSELASHLLKTGTAASSAEAEKRAREMIYGSVAASSAKPTVQEKAVHANSDEYIKMIETSHNLIMKELAAIKYKQDQFISEIVTLKSELNKMQIQAAAASRQIQAPVQTTEPRAAATETKQDSAPAAQPAPQTAAPKKNPDDISIEKYFYFGQKK